MPRYSDWGGKKGNPGMKWSFYPRRLLLKGVMLAHTQAGWMGLSIFIVESGLRPLCEVVSLYIVFVVAFFPLQMCFTLFVLLPGEQALDQSKACRQAGRHDRKPA